MLAVSHYIHGESRAAKEAREAEHRARQKVAKLARLEKELENRIAARQVQLRREPPVRTYRPTPEQLKYRDQHGDSISRQPAPQWGGQHNLHLASLEAAAWDQTRRRGTRKEAAWAR